MKAYQQLKTIFNRVGHFHYLTNLMHWDAAVNMPSHAEEMHSAAMTELNKIQYQLLTSTKVKRLFHAAEEETLASAWDQRNYALMKKKQINLVCIPAKLMARFHERRAHCEHLWQQKRAENNWQDFYPCFEEVVQLAREIALRRAEVWQIKPYDVLIDEYAPGFTEQQLNKIFNSLKQALPSVLQQYLTQQARQSRILSQGPFAVSKQRTLGLQVMQALQFDFKHGRVDTSAHPFCTGNAFDTRITTRYREDDCFFALFSVCHETGHALFEQGLPRAWINQPMGLITDMALHESQSLLIEKEVCSSLPFMQFLAPLLRKTFGSQNAFSPDNLYRIASWVEPNYIRIESDEISYIFHIILRYELEKKLFHGEIAVRELPEYWDAAMQQYLGLSTKDNYRQGVMQDVHWSAGLFGYFPAYALGRLIAAQWFATFMQQQPDYQQAFAKGDFSTLITWLRSEIHQQANLYPTQKLLLKVTKSELDPTYYIHQLQTKCASLCAN